MNEHCFKVLNDTWLAEMIGMEVFSVACKSPSCGKDELDTFITDHKDLFMYAKIPVTSVNSVRHLTDKGFYLVDTNLTFEKAVDRQTSKRAGMAKIGLAEKQDEEQAVRLAAESFIYSRFHQDGFFPKEVADKIKAEWVRNYFRGKRGDALIIARHEGSIIGFLQLLYRNDKTVVIDLVAVKKEYRQKGIAKDMIAFAEKENRRFDRIQVGTQVSNTDSVKAYETLGFRLCAASYVLHYHSRDDRQRGRT